MQRPLAFALAVFTFTAVASAPAKADPWWFLAGVVAGSVIAPAYSYPYGYRSGYAPVPAMAPWATSAPECHWTKVRQNGAWHHSRVCYDAAPAGYAYRPAEPLVRKY